MIDSQEPYIALRGVRKAFRIGAETIPIFSGLDLSIARGDFIAVMGPSGSGKSTLLNMLGGIDSPDAGEIRIGRSHLEQMGEGARAAWRAHGMGIVFQFYNLLPMLNAGENIELPLLLKPLGRKERHARVETVLELVGLAGRQRQFPSSMSGGQQQRVGIARAIVGDPDLLLCDEPTGDLDRKSANDILEMLGFLNRELHKTIIMVTHDPEAAAFARRTLHLNKGEFVEQQGRGR
ncbi:ABC transporter ATP-binding protein [Rhizobium leguminosarum]|jgi:putative ABC transport system ATP-binding protein|uniref:ATP-binding cassette domain-containing protein n=1 Tax=Rhizobium leguminosarum TaxID=384 RepID=A0A6P0DC27_RHILE|nr:MULTISPECIES: ABC transporter ATP-binding protein [Rhizobium]ASS56775.1 ABC transporter ATP-binding protein [Rhizobium leguminosarum bv. viciae]AVC50431.1 ABC transporter family protein [Rhizobium leguminosarum bv. viciae]MBB4326200.1 putative ABC transport system ATP-binding protein [Rhizobium leguminosarum]MBB4339440.1 putative ABC transport system ATP-binding protein [Rhizobium leguminosarum]MBB4352509.1 putative ABC transport system ATP-binding protein [Rhizobium leguminosarum]